MFAMKSAARCALAALAALSLATWAPAAETMKSYVVDVGTGLGMYFELPGGPEGRPWRIVYDTGKGRGKGLDNDLVSFLAAPEVGLRMAEGEFEGDVIDFFVLSHPHEDHFNGAKALFESFDVRNIVESKQIPSVRYLKNFKGPAIAEIARARAAGKDAHYYVAALPYPNGFDQPRAGQPYDEYALAEEYLPAFLKGKIDVRKHQGQVTWPFGPEQVAQTVAWPVKNLMGDVEKVFSHVPADLLEGTLDVEVIPVGTRFDLGRKKGAGFTVVHADTIAALDYANHDRKAYARAFPYYNESDLNDGSVSIQVTYGQARVFVPGDTEGRHKKPTKRVRLTDVFGSGEGADAYSLEDVMSYLDGVRNKTGKEPILDLARPYVMAASDLLRHGYHSYATLDQITPVGFTANKGPHGEVAGHSFASPADVPGDAVFMDRRNQVEKERLHPEWRERLFAFHQTLEDNRQKMAALRTRFKGWSKGSSARLVFDQALSRWRPDWENEVWTITNLVQLTERIYYVDPYLAHLLAGFIMRSEIFLEYMSPSDPEERALRGEKHMMHVADQIQAESGFDVLKSDVLVFGHHGSFTSSSVGFVHRVDPNVGVISADDKSYSGSTLPDFSALFWNLNSHHPYSRQILHSAFFHADLLGKARGEQQDSWALERGFSPSAARVFRARGRFPIPIWRTDFNDDLADVNTLMDNILIESDGEAPIWQFARHKKGERKRFIPQDEAGLEFLGKYQYWFNALAYRPKDGVGIRPHDPSGQIKTFDVRDRVPLEQDWDDDDHEDEDWTFHSH